MSWPCRSTYQSQWMKITAAMILREKTINFSLYLRRGLLHQPSLWKTCAKSHRHVDTFRTHLMTTCRVGTSTNTCKVLSLLVASSLGPIRHLWKNIIICALIYRTASRSSRKTSLWWTTATMCTILWTVVSYWWTATIMPQLFAIHQWESSFSPSNSRLKTNRASIPEKLFSTSSKNVSNKVLVFPFHQLTFLVAT